MAHAKYSPSGAERWVNCPGSTALSAGLEDEASEDAMIGTAAHHLGAECLKRSEDAAQYIGWRVLLLVDPVTKEHTEELYQGKCNFVSYNGNKVLYIAEIDDDMAADVQVYLDYVRAVVASTGGVLMVEQGVPLEHVTGEAGAEGTADVIIVTDDELIIIDLKFGRGHVVSAEENKQMLLYASGALSELELTNIFKRVRLVISQPRITHLPSEWDCTIDYLRGVEEAIRAAAALSESMCVPGAVLLLNASESACRWCRAKATCPKLGEFVQDASDDFDNLLVLGTPDVDQYDNSELAVKMACTDLVELWIKAVRAKTESELFQGHVVDGWKIVQGRRGARAWSDADEAEETMKSMRLKVDEMYNFKLKSPTMIEKVLKENPKKWKRVSALITQSDGKPSVAPSSDPREAIDVAPSADGFDDLTQGAQDAKE
jgi:hypothetical protein